MSRSFKLFRLQQIDSQLDQANTRLQEIEAILNDDRELQHAEGVIQETESLLEKAKKKLRQAEANTRAQRLKIQQTEEQLYGGSVRNPKELEDLHKESGALKRYLDVLEERQIESMLVVDEKEEVWQTAQSNLDRIRASRIESHAALLGERTKLSKEVERLLSERKAAISTIAEEDLGMYETLRQKRSGIAVAKVSDKSCTACGSSLSSSLHQTARSPVQITHCDTCGRILYVG